MNDTSASISLHDASSLIDQPDVVIDRSAKLANSEMIREYQSRRKHIKLLIYHIYLLITESQIFIERTFFLFAEHKTRSSQEERSLCSRAKFSATISWRVIQNVASLSL